MKTDDGLPANLEEWKANEVSMDFRKAGKTEKRDDSNFFNTKNFQTEAKSND